MTEFSIVVPVHNCESTIERSINSLLSQDYLDYEIIVVDTASTDRTLDIVSGIARLRDEVSVVALTENVKAATARKRGVAKTSGKYVMFLDADSAYLPHALSTLHRELSRTPVDIMHFGVAVECPDREGKRSLERYLAPYPHTIKGEESVFESCFVAERFKWSLVNKVFAGDLCRQAFSELPEKEIQCGGDLFAFARLAYHARSYRGLRSTPLYLYSSDADKDDNKVVGLDAFGDMCRSNVCVKEIRSMLKEWDAPSVWSEGFDQIENALIDNCIRKLHKNVSPSDQPCGAEILCEKWGIEVSLAAFMRRFWDNEGEAARILLQTPLAKSASRKVHHVAAYYHACEGGGAEAVLRKLLNLWGQMGYKVTLLTEKPPLDPSILPHEVDVIVLPTGKRPGALSPDVNSYGERIKALSKAISDNKIDAVVYHEWLNKRLLWDMLTIKAAGASFVIHCHGLFTFYMRNYDLAFAQMPLVFSLADAIVSINETDRQFWSKFNGNVFLTPNPPPFDPSKVHPKVCNDKRVLWLGRISPEKHPEEALRIFSYIHEVDPGATFCMAGKAINPRYELKIRNLADELGLSDVLEMPGWCLGDEKVEAFLNSRVFLMTSEATEGFPLTLFESKIAGIPCVMYDLPYLTMTQQAKGIKVVPQGSTVFAASEILAILEDDELYLKLKREARESISEIVEFDFEFLWVNVFSSLEVSASTRVPDSDLFWDVLFEAYGAGARRAHDKIEKMKESYTWKLGRAVTCIPRKAKRVAKRLLRRKQQ